MTSFRDLEPCSNFGTTGLIAIGWLERGDAFATGPVGVEAFERLRDLFRDPFQPVAVAGYHACSLCRFFPEARGTANLFVPAPRSRLFVCPELIIHYINAHLYRPPEEFLSAVLQCPDTRTTEYKRAFLSSGGRELMRGAG